MEQLQSGEDLSQMILNELEVLRWNAFLDDDTTTLNAVPAEGIQRIPEGVDQAIEGPVIGCVKDIRMLDSYRTRY